MTKRRDEIIIEVSRDGKTGWEPIEFPFKPGALDVAPRFVLPPFHLPRVDWLLWFVALRPALAVWPRWMWVLLLGIIDGTPEIVGLLDSSMKRTVFTSLQQGASGDWQYVHDYQYIRVLLYTYDFNYDSPAVDTPKQYWRRSLLTELLPPSRKEDIYTIYDGFMLKTEKLQHSESTKPPPTPENPTDAILRTFKGLKIKTKMKNL